MYHIRPTYKKMFITSVFKIFYLLSIVLVSDKQYIFMPESEIQLTRTKLQESSYSQNQNLQSYSHSEYLQPRKEKTRKPEFGEIVEGKWSQDQKLKYVLFVHHHSKIFKSKTKRKNLRVFKTLSEYLGTRTPRQCRSHFQKLMNRFKSLKKIIEHQQNQAGIASFLEAHREQAPLIQNYPKPFVVCQDFSCQTEFLTETSEYESALLRIRMLERMVYESNFFLNQAHPYFFPSPNCCNFLGL